MANNENVDEENYDEITLWQTTFPEGYAGFDRLGLQAQFRSWIASYDYSGVMAEDDVTEEELLEEQKMIVKEGKKKRAFGKSKRKKG